MKFTKGLFIGTALGISAAMMMNNKARNSNLNKQTSAIASDPEPQVNDYAVNDII